MPLFNLPSWAQKGISIGGERTELRISFVDAEVCCWLLVKRKQLPLDSSVVRHVSVLEFEYEKRRVTTLQMILKGDIFSFFLRWQKYWYFHWDVECRTCVYKSSEASPLFRGWSSMSRMLVGDCLRLQLNVCKPSHCSMCHQAQTHNTFAFDEEIYFPISQTALLIITKCESFCRRPHVRNVVTLNTEDLQNQTAQNERTKEKESCRPIVSMRFSGNNV